MKWLVDGVYLLAEFIRVLLDNLYTHTPAALNEPFSTKEARRILRNLLFLYTPKHGSWLNMVKIELSVLTEL
jgi:DDE superfamily endonuclease